MPATFTAIAFTIVVGALAACSDGQTAIRIDVRYDDNWALTGLQLASGTSSSTTDATHTVTILVPDAWDGQPQSISVIGMRGPDQWAQGTATVTPHRGDVVDTHAGLALLSCAMSCVEESQACVVGGLATCTQGADSCFSFGAPVACDSGTRCAGDACIAGDPVVLPSNSETFGALQQTGMTLDVATGSTFDTDADCTAGSPLGDCAPVVSIGSGVCVCRADTMTIHDLEVRGSRALAILAWSSVTVQGNLVIDPGAGLGATYPTDGSSGGSYGTPGGGGAPTYGNAELVPLIGGMSGQGTSGGLGGGAVQITADSTVMITGTISVSGAGAKPTGCLPDLVGHGGGSGGAVLLEARHVDVVGVVGANGGGGSGGGLDVSPGSDRCGLAGGPGVPSANAAPGGSGATYSCNNLIRARGGNGGLGSIGDGAGGESGPTDDEDGSHCPTGTMSHGIRGGGGGGAGRIRINTLSDACDCTGFMSPSPTRGTVVVE